MKSHPYSPVMKTTVQNKNRQSHQVMEEPKKRSASSKKAQILDSYQAGQKDIWHLAEDLGTQPSYVASVLQSAGLINGYYDLYTTSDNPMNIYAKEFQGQLGFKNQTAAERSVELIDRTYKKLSELKDRAGQHHCLVTAMTMYNRARFIGKQNEAEIFRIWLIRHLLESDPKFEEQVGVH